MKAPPSLCAAGRLWARRALDPALGVVEGLSAEWSDGLWTRVALGSKPPVDGMPCLRFDDGLLTPGLLNAHSHLDYSFLRDRLSSGRGFVPWLREMIAARRALTPADESGAREACRAAMQESLADGVTALWDIDALGWGRAELSNSSIDSIAFKEWIAPDPVRWRVQGTQEREAWFRECDAAFRNQNPGARTHPRQGLSPHSAYTVCPEALTMFAAAARQRSLPLAIHLAESPEERALLVEGRGALRELLAEAGGADPSAHLGAGRGAIARAQAAGLLTPAALAIHCNLPEPGDALLIARSGAAVVFCPRSHRFFDYPPYPFEDYRRSGIRMAFGTDSLASNEALSIRAEARTAMEMLPVLTPSEAFELSTGAALGDDPPFGARGLFASGCTADWSLWRLDSSPASARTSDWIERWLDPRSNCVESSVWTERVL